MRKIKLFLVAGTALLLTLSGCKKEDESPADPFKTEYSEKSVEANKAVIEDNSIELINLTDGLESSSAIEVTMNLAEKSDAEMTDNKELFFAPVAVLSMINENKPADEVFTELKSTFEDPESLDALWAEITGTYSWNSTKNTWDYKEGTDAIVIEFPGKEGDTENTAVYTVNNFTTQDISDPIIPEEELDFEPQLPASLHVDLKYKGVLLTAMDFSASYEDNGIPKNGKVVLTVDDFSITVEINHKAYSKANAKYSFKKGSKVLIELFAESNGDWSEENIENNTENEEFENIIKDANAYVQVLNIKVAGKVDINKLVPVIKELEENKDSKTEEESVKALAEALNEHAALVVINTAESKKLSEAEFYAYKSEDEWSSWWDISIRFVFADGSKVDAETYFNEGFTEFVDALNDVLKDISDLYDLDIEPIEYPVEE